MDTSDRKAIAAQYRDAWNDHDPDAIADVFAADGTFTDPMVGDEVAGDDIRDMADETLGAFPDLEFETTQLTTTDEGDVVFEWVMHGTHRGSLRGLPPTGNSIALPGMDIISVGSDGITSVRGYFDSRVMTQQLGFRVDVQPRQRGPFKFGTSLRLDLGEQQRPGAFSLTYIDSRDESDLESVIEHARGILREMRSRDGVISSVIAKNDGRAYTITAWESEEKAKALMDSSRHETAVSELFEKDGIGTAAMTSIWTPERFNGRILRCLNCGEVTYDVTDEDCSECDAPLPEEPPYW